MEYYLAIDIGASSGRHILGCLKNGKIILEEVYRFQNSMTQKNGHLIWDVDYLFDEIIIGMKKCKELNKVPISVGIDTWAVDYVLVDSNGNKVQDVYAYRDSRTKGMDDKIFEVISETELFAKTGIQKQPFNTIYQLKSHQIYESTNFARTKMMLMIPDYFNYLLTGVAVTEYTNATTTQLVNVQSKNWDFELIERLGLPKGIFQRIVIPGYDLGCILPSVENEIGYTTHVIVPATHDTGSAVISVPSIEKDFLYISSGTWSLMGTELEKAECSLESMTYNMTNEGGYEYHFRYLKNIMGMWMINSMRKEVANDLSFSEICGLAEKESIDSIVDVTDNRFMSPVSMCEEVKKACLETNQQIPISIGELAKVIYQSLANCYKKTALQISNITQCEYDTIHIVGGGCKADYLNQLTANISGKRVIAGPVEATSLGNIIVQMIKDSKFKNLLDAKKCIFESFDVKIYESK